MKYLKNNLLIILIFTFLLSFITYQTLDYKKEYQLENERSEAMYLETCSDTSKLNDIMLKGCQEWKMSLEEKPDFFDAYTLIELSVLDFVNILFLIIPSILVINQIFKDQVLINILTRESYSKFLRKLFTKVYRYIWLLPTVLIIFIGLLLSFTKFDLNTISYYYVSINNPITFLVCYVLNSIILSGLYLNIALINLRYRHNYYIATISSFIVYFCIYLILLIGVDLVFFTNTLEIMDLCDLFSISGIFEFNITDSISPIIRVLISLMFYIISWVVIYFCYKNKEKLIIDCEKNNKEEV